MFDRLLGADLTAALRDTPAVLLVGPRQAGKTTLARAAGGADRRYLTFDDVGPLAAAESDPEGFVAGAVPVSALWRWPSGAARDT